MFDFISNLYKKSDHFPVQEPGVTQFIDELPDDNPAVALEELTYWLVDLSNEADIDLQERVKRLARIDKSAQKYEYALRRQYTESSRMQKTLETRIWYASVDFLEATVSAHLRCAAKLAQKGEAYKQYLAVVIMRAMRRLDLHTHWLHLSYRPIPGALWGQLFFLIKLAEDRALLHFPVTLSSVSKTQTTIAQEMLRLLMMSVASPEHLTKTQINLAHVLTRNLAGTFCWEQLPRGSAIFQLDFSKPDTPIKLSKKPNAHFQVGCFGSAEAIRALIVGLMQLERGEIPAPLGTIDFANYKREDVLVVLSHLSQCWCKLDARNELQAFNKRHTQRKQVYYRISVVHSFDYLHEQIRQALATTSRVVGNAHESEPESWVVEDISEMGYGVTFSSRKEDWVKSNTVIGIQTDNGAWQTGVIRRVASEAEEHTQAGIQILSNQPEAVTLRLADSSVHTAHTAGIFMHREPPYQNQEALLLEAGSYELHRTYVMVIGENQRTIHLLERVNQFEGIDQIIFADVKSKA